MTKTPHNDDDYEWVEEKPTMLRKAIKVVRESVETTYGYASKGFQAVSGVYKQVDGTVADLKKEYPSEMFYAGTAGVAVSASLLALYMTRQASTPTRVVATVLAGPLAVGLVYHPAKMAALGKQAVHQGKEGYKWAMNQVQGEQKTDKVAQPKLDHVSSAPITPSTEPVVEIESSADPVVDRSVPTQAPSDAVVEKE